jgi:glycosyltransferase involved in cell wall biosynthesis
LNKLAIVITHPVQYYVPFFQVLSKHPLLEIKVFYTWGEDSMSKKFDPDFGREIQWDIPLLEGYSYQFVKNTAKRQGSHHFLGIINPDLISVILNFKPQAIMVYGWPFLSHLKLIRYFKGKVPVLFRGDSTLLDGQSGLKPSIRQLFLKWIYTHIDYALYVGTASKAYFKKMGLKESQLISVPHAIENDRFLSDHSHHDKAQKLRQELNIPPDDFVFIFVGKLIEKKQPLLLLKSFLTLKQRGIHLVFVGDGGQKEELQQMASATNNIHFMGFQNQQVMPAMYRIGNCLVLPSKGPGETWGLAVNEAMASGLPVIVSNKVGCHPDLVVPGKTGYVFESTNQQDLTDKMHKIMMMNRKQTISYVKNYICDWNYQTGVYNVSKLINSL